MFELELLPRLPSSTRTHPWHPDICTFFSCL